MTEVSHRFEPLAPNHELEAFDCGVPSYNAWLVNSAPVAIKSGTSSVTVLVERGTDDRPRVVGYFALAATSVQRQDVPNRARTGSLTPIPAYLLTKLALDRALQGDSDGMWGTQLLVGAFRQVIKASDLIGARLLVVDPDNDALVPWYAKHGFLPTGTSPRMYVKVATLRDQLSNYDG